MNKERERENAERNKKEKEGETLGVLSLFFFFFLPVVSFFANTRDDREQSRTFYVSFFFVLVLLFLLSSSSFTWHARKKMTKKLKPFLIRVFFSNSPRLDSPFYCAVLLREYRVRRTHNRLI